MKHVVGVADMKVSSNEGDIIITRALGSCLGITIHDPVAKVGGMLHVMLPLSTIDVVKAAQKPYMFIDTGVPKLFLECYKAGAKKERLVVTVAGGASIGKVEGEDHFQIGKRNILMLRKLMWKNNVLITAQDIGGNQSRTMSIAIGAGDVTLTMNGDPKP